MTDFRGVDNDRPGHHDAYDLGDEGAVWHGNQRDAAGISIVSSLGLKESLGKNGPTYTQVVSLLPTMKTRDINAALNAFRRKGGTLRTRDLIAFGVHTDSLYACVKRGKSSSSVAVFIAWPMSAKRSIPTLLSSPRARRTARFVSSVRFHIMASRRRVHPPPIWPYGKEAITASNCRSPSRFIVSIRKRLNRGLKRSASAACR